LQMATGMNRTRGAPAPPGQADGGRGESAAYHALTVMNKLVTKYRIDPNTHSNVLDVEPANSSIATAQCVGCLFCCCMKNFVVQNGNILLADNGSGGFPMYGAGVHLICNPFLVQKQELPIWTTRITNGPHTICTIQQGHVGVCEDMGEPVLLPPGMHQWDSPTLKFHEEVDLSSNHVPLGPYTIITVDEGYAGITTDNGKQKILKGGTTTMLTHRNWKFEKFISMKLNSNELKAIEATSADNVTLHVEATVVWQVTNAEDAARSAADTMNTSAPPPPPPGGSGYGETSTRSRRRNVDNGDDTLRALANDVLKQARASLAMYIGELRYMDTFHMASTIQEKRRNQAKGQPGTAGPEVEYSTLYDDKRMAGCVGHANDVTNTYGVTVVSINIISATAADRNLSDSLAKGARAAAEAEQIETTAHADAKASRINQDVVNENMKARARAKAESLVIEAEGKKAAAGLIESSSLACELARLSAMEEVLGDKASYFFGSTPSDLSTMLAQK